VNGVDDGRYIPLLSSTISDYFSEACKILGIEGLRLSLSVEDSKINSQTVATVSPKRISVAPMMDWSDQIKKYN